MIGWNDVYNVPWPEYLLSSFFWLATVRNGTQKDESMQQFMRTASIIQAGLSIVCTQLLLMQWSAAAAHLYSQERLSRMGAWETALGLMRGSSRAAGSDQFPSIPAAHVGQCKSCRLHLSPGCVTPAVIHLSLLSLSSTQPQSIVEHSSVLFLAVNHFYLVLSAV